MDFPSEFWLPVAQILKSMRRVVQGITISADRMVRLGIFALLVGRESGVRL